MTIIKRIINKLNKKLMLWTKVSHSVSKSEMQEIINLLENGATLNEINPNALNKKEVLFKYLLYGKNIDLSLIKVSEDDIIDIFSKGFFSKDIYKLPKRYLNKKVLPHIISQDIWKDIVPEDLKKDPIFVANCLKKDIEICKHLETEMILKKEIYEIILNNYYAIGYLKESAQKEIRQMPIFTKKKEALKFLINKSNLSNIEKFWPLLSPELQNDKDLIYKCIKKDISALKVVKDTEYEKDLIKILLEKNSKEISSISDNEKFKASIVKHEDLIELALKKELDLYYYFNKEQKKDIRYALILIENMNYLIDYIIEDNPEFLQNKEFVYSIIKINPKHYSILSQEFKKDKNVLSFMVEYGFQALKLIDKSLHTKNMILKSLDNDNYLPANVISDHFYNDRDIAKKLIKAGASFSSFNEKIQSDKKLALLACEYSAYNYNELPKKLKLDKDIIEFVIKKNESYINDVPKESWMNTNFMFKLIKNNPDCIERLEFDNFNTSSPEDKKIIIEVLNKYPETVNALKEYHLNDNEILMQAIKYNVELIKKLSSEVVYSKDFLYKMENVLRENKKDFIKEIELLDRFKREDELSEKMSVVKKESVFKRKKL